MFLFIRHSVERDFLQNRDRPFRDSSGISRCHADNRKCTLSPFAAPSGLSRDSCGISLCLCSESTYDKGPAFHTSFNTDSNPDSERNKTNFDSLAAFFGLAPGICSTFSLLAEKPSGNLDYSRFPIRIHEVGKSCPIMPDGSFKHLPDRTNQMGSLLGT